MTKQATETAVETSSDEGRRPQQTLKELLLAPEPRGELVIPKRRRRQVDSARRETVYALDPTSFDAFIQVVESPPEPGPKLKSLLLRLPAWKK